MLQDRDVLQGVVQRDEIVFREVREKRGIPIFMLTSGGYQVFHTIHTVGEMWTSWRLHSGLGFE